MVSLDPLIYHNHSVFSPENDQITLNRRNSTAGSVEEPSAAQGVDVAPQANG